MPDLRSTQRLLWRLISAPEGVAKAVRRYRTSSFPILGNRRLSKIKRLDIYANMYFFRILDCLKEDFPAVLKIIGKDRFHNLATDYLLKYPPRHWSLRYAGDRLPSFIKQHPIRKKHPFLEELAEMEWLLTQAFDARDDPPLRKEELESLEPSQWGKLSLTLHPSVHLKTFRWTVDQKKVFQKTIHLLVWRQGFKVYYKRIDKFEWKVIRSLKRGARLAKVCEMATTLYGEKEASLKVAGLLHKWIGNEILVTGECIASDRSARHRREFHNEGVDRSSGRSFLPGQSSSLS